MVAPSHVGLKVSQHWSSNYDFQCSVPNQVPSLTLSVYSPPRFLYFQLFESYTGSLPSSLRIGLGHGTYMIKNNSVHIGQMLTQDQSSAEVDGYHTLSFLMFCYCTM
jgi:hypothetical protein